MGILIGKLFSKKTFRRTRTKMKKIEDIFKRAKKEDRSIMVLNPHSDDAVPWGIAALCARAKFYSLKVYEYLVSDNSGGEMYVEGDPKEVRIAEAKAYASWMSIDEIRFAMLKNVPLPEHEEGTFSPTMFPPQKDIWNGWGDEAYEAVYNLAKYIRETKPIVFIMLHHRSGATRHPEHILSTRIANEALRVAANPEIEISDLETHEVEFVKCIKVRPRILVVGNWIAITKNVLNMINLLTLDNLGRLLRGIEALANLNKILNDIRREMRPDSFPLFPYEVWNGTKFNSAITGKTCADIQFEAADHFKSQKKDMDSVREYRPLLERIRIVGYDPYFKTDKLVKYKE